VEINVKVTLVRKQVLPGVANKLYSATVKRKDGQADIVTIWSPKDYPIDGKEVVVNADVRVASMNEVL